MLKVPRDKAVDGVHDKWIEATPSFGVQGVLQPEPKKAKAVHGSRSQGNLGSTSSLRKQQIALQYALDDLLEIVEAKTSDEEIRALAMRVQRLR
jgi:hypothetical protein